MIDAPIPAASLLLLREQPSFQVLMVERGSGMSFAGGALVFPGGRIDDSDRDPLWREWAHGLAEEEHVAAAMIAAIRETFEETGVLLARKQGANDGALIGADACDMLAQSRADLAARSTTLLEIVCRSRLTLACERLHLFSHWVAPPGLHRRFDTLFFAAAHPEGQIAKEDGDESTAISWVEPGVAMAARARGECKVIFPTARNLELLALSGCFEAVVASSRARRIEPMQPTLVERDGEHWLTIPDGYGYPVIEERLDASGRG